MTTPLTTNAPPPPRSTPPKLPPPVQPSAGKKKTRLRYDGSVFKVMILAGVLLVFATTLIGILSYRITEQEVVKKLKSNDLLLMARSISNQVDGRIDRAIETSTMLAEDPAVMEWVRGAEKDAKLQEIVVRQLVALPKTFDYTNSFVVSKVTSHYWDENGTILETLNENDKDDEWFYQTLKSGRKTSVVVDSNASRHDTFVFVNVLIGDPADPIGVAGVGMSLQSLSEDFATYKYGQESRLWMTGPDGTIHLSDSFGQIGTNIDQYLPEDTLKLSKGAEAGEQAILESEDNEGRFIDLISYPIRSADLRLVAIIPRSETLGFLQAIKFNTALAVVVSVVLIVFFFFYVSRKLADPYKRALLMNAELERKVEARTIELATRNKEMTDSISYANRIQLSVLPTDGAMERSFEEHFALWKPRDVVGGDFYWVKKVGEVQWVAVGDCTGHGVPGALMTMLSVSLLNRIADSGDELTPSDVLGKLNVLLKETLNQTDPEGLTDDGLDLGLAFIGPEGVEYAGTGISLAYGDTREELRSLKGDKRKIGYRRTPTDYRYTNHRFEHEPERLYYLISDGVVDQNGGPKKLSLGRTRLIGWLNRYREYPLREQLAYFEKQLSEFMAEEPQRDDMTMLAFKPAVRVADKEL